jgi:hypothetical protein
VAEGLGAPHLPWKPEHLRDSSVWFNPWPIKYLMPVVKWFPLYWPHAEWEITTLDELGNRVAPKPPDGAIIPWWKMPKDQWPIEAPWEPKVFGAWPASQITMSEDLPPSIWPGGHRTPPFGFIKLKMPGERDTSVNEIPFNHWRMHMRPDFGPIHHMKMLTEVNALGETKFYMIDKNWNKYEYDWQEYRAAMKAKRKSRHTEELATEISRTKGQPRPMEDLFV